MSGVAWQIPLHAGQDIPQFGPDPQKLLNEQVTAAKLAELNRQTQQDQQGQNALKQLYANPDNFGPDGRLKPEAIRTIGMADPAAAVSLQSSLTHDALAQAQLKIASAKEGEEVIAEKMKVGQEANSVYQMALKEGGPAAAQRAAQDAWSTGRNELISSGLASPEAIASMPPNYDFNRVNRSVSAWNASRLTPIQQFDIGEKEKADTRADVELGIKKQESENKEFNKPEERDCGRR